MNRVTGIGGIFFKAKDPDALGAWYRDHRGLAVADWGGAIFNWGWPGQRKGHDHLEPFQERRIVRGHRWQRGHAECSRRRACGRQSLPDHSRNHRMAG